MPTSTWQAISELNPTRFQDFMNDMLCEVTGEAQYFLPEKLQSILTATSEQEEIYRDLLRSKIYAGQQEAMQKAISQHALHYSSTDPFTPLYQFQQGDLCGGNTDLIFSQVSQNKQSEDNEEAFEKHHSKEVYSLVVFNEKTQQLNSVSVSKLGNMFILGICQDILGPNKCTSVFQMGKDEDYSCFPKTSPYMQDKSGIEVSAALQKVIPSLSVPSQLNTSTDIESLMITIKNAGVDNTVLATPREVIQTPLGAEIPGNPSRRDIVVTSDFLSQTDLMKIIRSRGYDAKGVKKELIDKIDAYHNLGYCIDKDTFKQLLAKLMENTGWGQNSTTGAKLLSALKEDHNQPLCEYLGIKQPKSQAGLRQSLDAQNRNNNKNYKEKIAYFSGDAKQWKVEEGLQANQTEQMRKKNISAFKPEWLNERQSWIVEHNTQQTKNSRQLYQPPSSLSFLNRVELHSQESAESPAPNH